MDIEIEARVGRVAEHRHAALDLQFAEIGARELGGLVRDDHLQRRDQRSQRLQGRRGGGALRQLQIPDRPRTGVALAERH